MKPIPLEAISRHCHLFKVLEVQTRDSSHFKSAILGCTNLVELTIEVSVVGKILNEEARLTEGQLLRSNPKLKTLHWIGSILVNQCLTPQDFIGLKFLERLVLLYWDCSDGRLARTLRAVSGTLKEFTLRTVTGLEPGGFSSQGDDDIQDKNTGAVNTEQHAELRLERLEKLCWDCSKTSFDCIVELIKLCPNLKHFKLTSQRNGCLIDLAENLRLHCHALRVSPSGYT
jgi:hypothetical protein